MSEAPQAPYQFSPAVVLSSHRRQMLAPEFFDWRYEKAIGVGKTAHKEYREYPDRFLKRSLGPTEQVFDRFSGLPISKRPIKLQLENEAASLRFIRRFTDIPVPKVIAAYEKDGLYFLWTDVVHGVPMKQLPALDQQVVMREVERHVATLQSLRSHYSGGPTGLTCVPNWLRRELPVDFELFPVISDSEDFVYCHMDLGQSNIIVDPETLRITAILDWEFSGFYPDHFEGHYYRRPERSGQQYKALMDVPKVTSFFTECPPQNKPAGR